MCRWLAYSGAPILLRDALYSPAHSLIDQSLHSRLGAETTNGDGYGIGWYGADPVPAVFRSVDPAWNDANLRDLSAHIRSRLFFAHIRASSGSAVQRTNCHPFRHGRWLWMHNGLVEGFPSVKRDLVIDVDPSLYPRIEGQTDSEVLFYLALTMGLEDDPPAAVAATIALVEAAGHRAGVAHPMQGTIATTNGERLWVFRYSSAGRSRTLFVTTDVPTLRLLYPENELLERLSDETRVVVSEPLGDLPGVWNEVPESSYVVIDRGHAAIRSFAPAGLPHGHVTPMA